jgi:hypothetical protein
MVQPWLLSLLLPILITALTPSKYTASYRQRKLTLNALSVDDISKKYKIVTFGQGDNAFYGMY